jgi:hypothetical protein
MNNEKYPPGWNAKRVRRVLEYYESQSDEEAAAEIKSASEKTMMEVPTALVPMIRRMIASKTPSRNSRTRSATSRSRAQEKINTKTLKKPRA